MPWGFLIICGPAIFMGLIGILIYRAYQKDKQEIKDETNLSIFDNHIEGTGVIIHKGSNFSGAGMSMNGSPVFVGGGTLDKMELRDFMLKYSQIMSVETLTDEPGIVINTSVVSYICYIEEPKEPARLIFERIGN